MTADTPTLADREPAREAIAQALFDRLCARCFARGREPHHPPGTRVASMPPSYRDDYFADADAILALPALASERAAREATVPPDVEEVLRFLRMHPGCVQSYEKVEQALRSLAAERDEWKRKAESRLAGLNAEGDAHWSARDRLAAAEAEVARLQAEVGRLTKDKARLDFLDRMNAALNARYGTKYRWRLILNHNVNRLMLDHFAVDLHDSDGSKDALPSCREAIDAEMRRLDTHPAPEADHG